MDWGGWASAGADLVGTVVPGGQFIDDVLGGIGDFLGIGGGGPEGVSSRGQFEGLPLNDFLDSVALDNRAKQRMFTAWQAVGQPVTAPDGLGRPQTDPTGYSPVLKKALGVALRLVSEGGNRAALQFLNTVQTMARGNGFSGVAGSIAAGIQAAQGMAAAGGGGGTGTTPTVGFDPPPTAAQDPLLPAMPAMPVPAARTQTTGPGEAGGMSTQTMLLIAAAAVAAFWFLTEKMGG